MSRLLLGAVLPPSPYLLPIPDGAFGDSSGAAAHAAATWPSANRAILYPFSLPVTRLMSSMSVSIAVQSGTYDLGIYEALGITRLASMGSTTVPAAGLGLWTPTNPILLEAGVRYYAAMACSNTTASFARYATAALTMRLAGCTQMAAAHPLPSTFTPAAPASAYMPLIALTFVT